MPGWCAPRSCARCRRRWRATRSAPRPPAASATVAAFRPNVAPRGGWDWRASPARPLDAGRDRARGLRRGRAGGVRRRRAGGGCARRRGGRAPDLLDRPLGAARAQLHETYIVAQTRDGIVIVDQHAAHERIVYERMKAALERSGVARQILLIPEIVELDEADVERLTARADELAQVRPRGRAVRAGRGRGLRDAVDAGRDSTRRRWCAILPSTWPNGTRRCRSSAG